VTRAAAVVVAACTAAAPPPSAMPAVTEPAPAAAGRPPAPRSLAAEAAMVAIPAGRYIAGSTRAERDAAYEAYRASAGHDAARTHGWFENEDERHEAELPAFRIDRVPVTQAAFAEFVAAGRAAPPAIDEATWRTQGFQQDWSAVVRFVWTTNRPPAGRDDHPVVLVTWREADAYCKWRGRLHGAARRLPTADELEKAARGENGSEYPWGDTYDPAKLDSAVAGPHDTMPVGSFADGASPYGVLDLAGNVFEWTGTPFAAGKMTVKGSAWDDWAGVGRGASRHGRGIDIRHVIVGFRCAADGE